MTTYQVAPATTWRRLRTGLIFAVPGHDAPLQLDPVGAIVWELIQEPTELGTLVSGLAVTFDHAEAEVALAVGHLLDELVAAGAVVQG